MRIYILRHGISEPRRPGKPDAARKLTKKGKQRLVRVLEGAKQAGVTPDLVLSSPLARAVETAQLAAEVLGHAGEIAETDALAPDATPQQLWQEIRKRKSAGNLLLAGHEPHLGKSIAYLLGVPDLTIDLKKGALVRLDVDRLNGEPHAVLKWLLTPGLC